MTEDKWAGDPHRYNPNVHFRLYSGQHDRPVVICVQDFDYPDYDPNRILSSQAWDTQDDADAALAALLAETDPNANAFKVGQRVTGRCVTMGIRYTGTIARIYRRGNGENWANRFKLVDTGETYSTGGPIEPIVECTSAA